MPSVSGVEMQYALKKGTTWGTAVEAGAGDGLLMLPTGIRRDAPIEVDDSQGLVYSQDGTPGLVSVEGDLPAYLRYDGMGLLLALFMGATGGAPSLHAGGAGSYDYQYDLADALDGLFATLVRHWKNYVEEIPSVKIESLTIKGERGKPLQIVAKAVGSDSVRDGVNDATTFLNVTIPETANRIQFSQGVFRMNDQSDIALAAGDKIYPNSFELTATRKGTRIASGALITAGSSPQDLIDEPVIDGKPEVSLKFGFPYHTSKTRLDELGSDTRKKADITFTGPIIEGAIPRLFKLEFPHLQMKSVDVVDAAGNIDEPVEFICHGISAAPAGMTGLTNPFRITGTNQRSTDPLA